MPDFSVKVNAANPGQFFACCGLLELAHRLWPGAEGCFRGDAFYVEAMDNDVGQAPLVDFLRRTSLASDDAAADEKTCPLRLESTALRFPPLRLDWWLDKDRVGGLLKTWAGQQRVTVIGRAMLSAAVSTDSVDEEWFNHGMVVCAPGFPGKAVESFYFDARRYARALDAGFSLDAVGAESIAYPSVEFLALIGLQRFRPRTAGGDRWTCEYFTWNRPLGVAAAAVACGAVPVAGRCGFRFSLRFRDEQKRYKAFGFASLIGGDT